MGNDGVSRVGRGSIAIDRKSVAAFRVKESDPMRDIGHGLRRTPLAAFLALSITSLAMMHPPHAPAEGGGVGPVLAPRTTIVWSIQSADAQPMKNMNGESIIGPDGRMM